jgi:hypothetical protein
MLYIKRSCYPGLCQSYATYQLYSYLKRAHIVDNGCNADEYLSEYVMSYA